MFAAQQSYIAPWPLLLIGPVLFIAAAWLISWAARGSFGALVGLILLVALDLGTYGLVIRSIRIALA